MLSRVTYFDTGLLQAVARILKLCGHVVVWSLDPSPVTHKTSRNLYTSTQHRLSTFPPELPQNWPFHCQTNWQKLDFFSFFKLTKIVIFFYYNFWQFFWTFKWQFCGGSDSDQHWAWLAWTHRICSMWWQSGQLQANPTPLFYHNFRQTRHPCFITTSGKPDTPVLSHKVTLWG